MPHKILPWAEPLQLAAAIPADMDYWALLYSSMALPFSGRYSLLGLFPKAHIKGKDFTRLTKALSANKPTWENAWFGYFGYGLKNQLEELPQDTPSFLTLPDLWWVQFHLVLVFDHQEQQLKAFAEDTAYFDRIPTPGAIPPYQPGPVATLRSNMTRAEYLEKVAYIKEAILRGDLYQANLTRKFFGELASAPHSLSLFAALCEISPSPYSACLKWGEHTVLSSSPERFLHINSKGAVETRPIKGSAPRHRDKAKDTASRTALQESAKDRAENLMIVDLSRNDLARGCMPGSVQVPSLFNITSYATIHHMDSVIQGQKRAEVPTLEFIQECFPPGSMTGTPKIKAMQLCSRLERQARGVYAGALGWLGGDGSADLSVVIRTLILEDNKFEFQVGGAIVADSEPEKEWQETLTKARGVAGALGIAEERLAGL